MRRRDPRRRTFEFANLGRRRRQAGDVERRPPQQSQRIGRRRRLQAFTLQAARARTRSISLRAHFAFLGCGTATAFGSGRNDQCSVNSAPSRIHCGEQCFLFGRKHEMRVGRRHPLLVVVAHDPADELALVRVARARSRSPARRRRDRAAGRPAATRRPGRGSGSTCRKGSGRIWRSKSIVFVVPLAGEASDRRQTRAISSPRTPIEKPTQPVSHDRRRREPTRTVASLQPIHYICALGARQGIGFLRGDVKNHR